VDQRVGVMAQQMYGGGEYAKKAGILKLFKENEFLEKAIIDVFATFWLSPNRGVCLILRKIYPVFLTRAEFF
jgi:hypothetical protein